MAEVFVIHMALEVHPHGLSESMRPRSHVCVCMLLHTCVCVCVLCCICNAEDAINAYC